jgi:hypothetical protein
MMMCFQMLFAARTTEKVDDLLPILSLWHNAFSHVVQGQYSFTALLRLSENSVLFGDARCNYREDGLIAGDAGHLTFSRNRRTMASCLRIKQQMFQPMPAD